jgi:hypothetical protein
MEGNVRLYRQKIEAGEMTEGEAAAILGKSVWEAQGKVRRLWPTPTVQDSKNDGGPSQWERNSDPLNVAVKRWPIPTADDANNATRQSGQCQSLTPEPGGQLNPQFVSWLMGFPLDWCDMPDESREMCQTE